MANMSFTELRDQVVALYYQNDLAGAYGLLVREGPRFPEHAANIAYWRACLDARLGRPDDAVAVLRQAYDMGHWWSSDRLNGDADLAILRGHPAYQALLRDFDLRAAEAQRIARPLLAVLPTPDAPAPHPVLFGLHGNSGNASSARPFWAPARELGYLVAIPQSSQVAAPEAYSWDDWSKGEHELSEHVALLHSQRAIEPRRVVLGGFSRGAGLAAWAALSGAVPAAGFIAVAVSIPDINVFAALLESGQAQHVRGYFVLGENDAGSLERGRELAGMMQAAGMDAEYEIHPNLGHDFPTEWEKHLARALEFVTK